MSDIESESESNDADADAEAETDKQAKLNVGGEAEIETETREMEMRRFNAVSGYAADDGFRFPVTMPLSQVEVTLDDLEGDTEAAVYLSEPDPDEGMITGALFVGEDLPEGRNKAPFRRVMNFGTSLIIYLSAEEIEQMGVDTEGKEQVVLDVWAGPDGIAFRQLDVREVVVDTDIDHALDALPDQMRADYEAIEKHGWTPEEWAEERGLTPIEERKAQSNHPKYYIKQNVKEAKRRLGELEE